MQLCHFFFTNALVIHGFKLHLFSWQDDSDSDFLPSESDISEDDQSDPDNDISASESEDENEQAKVITIVQSILNSPTLNNTGSGSIRIDDIGTSKNEDKNKQPKLPTIEEPILNSPMLNKFGSRSCQTDEMLLLDKQSVINKDTDDEFDNADVDSDTTKNKNDVTRSKLGKHDNLYHLNL